MNAVITKRFNAIEETLLQSEIISSYLLDVFYVLNSIKQAMGTDATLGSGEHDDTD